MSEHIHQWKRWPIVNFSCDYSCAECGEPGHIVWVAAYAGWSIEDMDEHFARTHGGVYAGEMRPLAESRP